MRIATSCVLVLGLQQVLDRAGRKRGEGFVGRREDGERAFALQRLDEARGLDGGDERVEGARADGGVDDVLGVDEGRGADGGRGGEGEKRSAEHVVSPPVLEMPFSGIGEVYASGAATGSGGISAGAT